MHTGGPEQAQEHLGRHVGSSDFEKACGVSGDSALAKRGGTRVATVQTVFIFIISTRRGPAARVTTNVTHTSYRP